MTYSFWSKNLFLFLLPLTLLGQAQKKDLTHLSYDSLRDLFFTTSNNIDQLNCANAYLAKAKKENIDIRVAKGFFLLSKSNRNEKALHYLDSVIEYSKKLNDLDFPAIAYCEKGFIYLQQHKTKESIENYLIAEKLTHQNNLDYYYNIRYNIAIVKSEELGQIKEAMILYKECLKYYNTKNYRKREYCIAYQNVLFALADGFKALHQNDSATYFNRKGFLEAVITKDDFKKNIFILNEGATQVQNKKYKIAIDSINKALPKMIFYGNEGNTLAGYYYLGKAYYGLKEKEKAISNFIKVDSVYKVSKRITPEFVSGYPILISYFKNKGNKQKQLEYLTTYLEIDSTLSVNYKQINSQIETGYDMPHLIKEKEILIQSLKTNNTQSHWGIVTLFILLLPVAGFAHHQHQLKKTYKTRFQKIIDKHNAIVENRIDTKAIKMPLEKAVNKSEEIGISEELVIQVLNRLKLFEDKKEYLKSNITIQTLSQEFDTNTKYLSKIINEYKEKPFIQYINDLRIQNAITILQHNKTYRKYTIQALALEFGFNNAESFSTAFYKNAGIKPSFFLKELENIK